MRRYLRLTLDIDTWDAKEVETVLRRLIATVYSSIIITEVTLNPSLQESTSDPREGAV